MDISYNEQVEKERKIIRSKLDETRKERLDIDKDEERLCKEKELAVKELEDRVKAIEKPYDEKINELRKRDAVLREKVSKLERREMFKPLEVAGRFALKNGKIETGDEFNGVFYIKHDFKLHTVERIQKPLPNGAILFRTHDSSNASEANTVAYIAMKAMRVIGFHFTRKSEHPGDDAQYYAWIGTTLLRRSNIYTMDRKYAQGSQTYKSDPRFKEWKELVGKYEGNGSVDMDDEGNAQVMSSTWYIKLPDKEEGLK